MKRRAVKCVIILFAERVSSEGGEKLMDPFPKTNSRGVKENKHEKSKMQRKFLREIIPEEKRSIKMSISCHPHYHEFLMLLMTFFVQ